MHIWLLHVSSSVCFWVLIVVYPRDIVGIYVGKFILSTNRLPFSVRSISYWGFTDKKLVIIAPFYILYSHDDTIAPPDPCWSLERPLSSFYLHALMTSICTHTSNPQVMMPSVKGIVDFEPIIIAYCDFRQNAVSSKLIDKHLWCGEGKMVRYLFSQQSY